MEYSSVEVTVISCSNLKAFNFFKKLRVYAAVSIVNDEADKSKKKLPHLQRQKTITDKDGGKNPEWNHAMEFDLADLSLDADNLYFLKFDLRCERLVNKSIGEVRVPLKELIDEYKGAVRYARYQVRSSYGEPNGVLDFSYKVNKKVEKTGSESLNVNSASEVHVPSERVQYPSLEVDTNLSYPSLDDIYSPRSNSFNISPVYYSQMLQINNTTAPLPLSPLSPQSLPVHPPGGNMFYDSAACGSGSIRYPELRQLDRLGGYSWKFRLGSGGVSQET